MAGLLSNRAEKILRDADRVCRFGTGLHSALLFQVIGVFAVPVFAQTEVSTRDPDSFVNQQRILAERVRDSLDRELTFAQKVSFDFGGWYSLYLLEFDDGVNSSRTLRRHDLRLWSRLAFAGGAHEFYARGRLSLLDFNSGDSFDGNDNDVEGPNLERGYYRFDLNKGLTAYGRPVPEGNLVVKLGRDLVRFGNGLALATPLDHVSTKLSFRNFEITALAGKTVGSSRDFDLSRTAKRTRRSFLGGEVKYRRFQRHEPFTYALWQRDRNREQRTSLFQRYGYDSFHVGVGSRGELFKGLYYAAECVYQTGRSYGDGRFLRDNRIDAWGANAQLEYMFPGRRQARASVEYLFGSGDADRVRSPTNSAGGNTADFTDNSFIGFGWRDTGLSFAPRYSNLHMWRAGGSLFPWPEHPKLDRLEIGADWYLYYKHHRAGAVSDPTASAGSGYLGWEMDYYVNWEITMDFSWTARCGVFMPGSAFADRTTRTFVLVGMSWRF